ncbi:7-cyano-7-deazaguanine synthase QueC [bacterium]|nr:7-cyano-7-deazaguanine synthase QueC [bacterium]
MKKAVILLSGGLDSATVLAIAKSQGFECHCLSFRYGQRHTHELEAAARVAAHLGAKEHRIAELDLRLFGGSALTADIAVPKDREEAEMAAAVPATYVPARNTIFLSMALAYAEVLGAFDIFIGVNAVDYSGYPDCRPEYIAAFEKLANLATASGTGGSVLHGAGHFRIHTPLIDLTKAQIIQQGTELGVDYGLTLSCYDPVDGKPCGHCDACHLRAKGFAEAGLADKAA